MNPSKYHVVAYLIIIFCISIIQKSESFTQIHNTKWNHVPFKYVSEKQSISRALELRETATSQKIEIDLTSKRKETPFWKNLAAKLTDKIYPIPIETTDKDMFEREKLQKQIVTILRVGIPSILYGLVAYLIFPSLAMGLASLLSDDKVFYVLSTDSSQYIQNALTVVGLLFSILVGQTYYFMYQQQENVYFALFREVTEAKSLLEQVALVCQGRSMYYQVLSSIQRYVTDDLKQLQADPAVLLSRRPIDDPLESVMYMTSVGVPSSVYETVRSLRQARAERLGALQRKLPKVHLLLLWILAGMELSFFPLLGAGTQSIAGYNILTVEGVLFGVMTAGVVMTLRVVSELWRPAGGAYNVDSVLSVMVRGLDEELIMRIKGMKGGQIYRSPKFSPTREVMVDVVDEVEMQSTVKKEIDNYGAQQALGSTNSSTDNNEVIMTQQGGSLGIRRILKRFSSWLIN